METLNVILCCHLLTSTCLTLSQTVPHRAPRETSTIAQLVAPPFNEALFFRIKECICKLEQNINSQNDSIQTEIDELISTIDNLIKFKEFQNHQGAKECFAGNNGTGQSARLFFDIDPLAPIAGTRVSDTTFTRTSGTFETPIASGTAVAGGATTITLDAGASTVNDFYNTNIISITSGTGVGQIRTISNYVGVTKVATVSQAWTTIPDATSVFEIVSGLFVGQYAFSYGGVIASLGTWPPAFQALSAISNGIWLPIVQNTSTSIVVDGILNATGNNLITSVFNPKANLYPHGKGGLAFSGGVFDGKYLWLSPYLSTDIVRVDPATGAMTSIPHDKNVIRAFGDAVYDGESVWLVPYSSRDIIKIAADGTLSSIAHGKGSLAFWGGTFDGTHIWFAPQNSPDILKIDPATGDMTSIPHGKAGGLSFIGAVFDGCNVWLAPFNSPDILKINPETDAITSISHGKGTFAFAGGVFDGRYVWMFPFNSPDVIRIDPASDTFDSFAHGQGTFAYFGGSFDGKNIWAAPQFAEQIMQINPTDGTINFFPHGQGSSFVYWGSVFDGTSVWFVPSNSANLWRLYPPRCGKGNLNVPGCLSVGNTLTHAGAFRDTSIQLETPASGDTVIVSANTAMLLLNPAAGLAALTITLPSVGIDNGQIITISSDMAITVVTLNGGTINGAITTLAANGFAQYIYELSTDSWYRIG